MMLPPPYFIMLRYYYIMWTITDQTSLCNKRSNQSKILYWSQREVKCRSNSIQSLQRVSVDSWEDRFPVAVCITVNVKKLLTEDCFPQSVSKCNLRTESLRFIGKSFKLNACRIYNMTFIRSITIRMKTNSLWLFITISKKKELLLYLVNNQCKMQ